MSYFSYDKGQILNGLGACGCSGCGCSGLGGARIPLRRAYSHPFPLRGFGSADVGGVEFSAADIWSNWMAGQTCGQDGGDCASAAAAINLIRVALAKLGYGEQSLDQMWGAHDMASYKAWASDAGQTSNGMPLKAQLSIMETQLKQNKKPGPEPVVNYDYVPGTDSTFMQKYGLTTIGLVALGLVAVSGLGYMAYRSKKKHAHVHGDPLKA